MWLKQHFFYLTIVVQYVFTADLGDNCEVNDQVAVGVCKRVKDCEPAARQVQSRGSHDFGRCGFSGFDEIVCCPTTTSKFGTTDSPTVEVKKRIAEIECEKMTDTSRATVSLFITGGETASIGEFPHMAGIGYDKGFGYQFDCGGSIISNKFIVTAAHCVDTLEGIEPTIVRAGVIDINGTGFIEDSDYRISEIIVHPNYTRQLKYHDLALLRLETPLRFSSYLSPICLDTVDLDPIEPLVITGWGKTSNSRDIKSNMLLKATVKAVSSEKCGESYVNWRKLPQGIASMQLCAGDPEGLQDTCQGDSGGPLVRTPRGGPTRLVGVTSFGRGCGSPVPGVYTRVQRYLGWLEANVWPK